jgi:hypothetical protein
VAQKQGGGLQIDEDLAFQRRSWTVQRLGFALMGLVLVGALFGVLGAEGPLAESEAHAEGLSVRYARFGRRLTSSTLEVSVDPSRAREGVVSLWVSADYLDTMAAQRVSPRPRAVVAGGDRTIYTFDVSAAASRPVRITFDLKPRALFRHAGRIGLDAGAELPITTFVYP